MGRSQFASIEDAAACNVLPTALQGFAEWHETRLSCQLFVSWLSVHIRPPAFALHRLLSPLTTPNPSPGAEHERFGFGAQELAVHQYHRKQAHKADLS